MYDVIREENIFCVYDCVSVKVLQLCRAGVCVMSIKSVGIELRGYVGRLDWLITQIEFALLRLLKCEQKFTFTQKVT